MRIAHRAALVAATLVALAGCAGGGGSGSAGGSSSTGGGSSGGGGGGAPTPPATPPLDAARVAQARAAIDAAIADPSIAGNTCSVFVVDDESGEVVYERSPDLALIPASNTKLFTTAAALALLGVDHRMETRAIASAAIGAGGVLAGDLVLHSEHDFTLSTEVYESARYPLDRLAARLYAAGLRRVSGALRVYGAWCYDASSVGTYDPAAHRAAVQGAAMAALSAAGITVSGGSGNVASMDPPVGYTVTLASWQSAPLSVACYPINVVSHNEMADILCRHLGWKRLGASDYPTGTQVVTDWAASIGVSGVVIHDGSGLDVDNRISARHFVELIRRVSRLPFGPVWTSTFSVGGVSGTLAGRMGGADVRGRFFGKSGTNLGICTSGFLVNRHDGRRYVVSALMNTLPSGSAAAARLAQDRIVAAVAVDLRGAGAPPEAPVLAEVASQGGGTILARWGAVAGAAGYYVYPSADGVSFPRAGRVYTTATSWLATGLAPGSRLALRVAAVSASGEGAPSDAYAASAGSSSGVLVVDANDRWQRERADENAIGASHGFAAEAALSLPRGGFDTCANEEVASGAVDLSRYAAVLWLAGEDGSVDAPIDAAEQQALAGFVAGGGRLLVSGAEVLWDLDRPANADAADHAFARDVLGVSYVDDDAGTYVVEGSAGGPLAAAGTLGFYTPGAMHVSYPDRLAPVPSAGGSACAGYAGGVLGTAAVLRSQGAARVITLGFPLESIDERAARARVLDGVLAFFGM